MEVYSSVWMLAKCNHIVIYIQHTEYIPHKYVEDTAYAKGKEWKKSYIYLRKRAEN